MRLRHPRSLPARFAAELHRLVDASRGGWTALVLATVMGSGCYATRTQPALPLPVQYVSRVPFEVHGLRATIPDRPITCAALQVTGHLRDMRGDTLFFSDARITRRPSGTAECALAGEAFVVTSRAPELRARSGQIGAGRSALATVVVVAGGLFLLVVLAVAAC